MRIALTLAVNTTALAVNTTALAANTDGAHREHEQAAAMGSVFWPGGLVDGARCEPTDGARCESTDGARCESTDGARRAHLDFLGRAVRRNLNFFGRQSPPKSNPKISSDLCDLCGSAVKT